MLSRQGNNRQHLEPSAVSELIDDDLPLPSFLQVFGFTVSPPSHNKSHKRKLIGSDGMDTRILAKRLKLDDFEKGGKHHDSGRWTAEEHRLFLEGVMLYGKDWKKMQPLIKTRSLVQIRTHAQKVFKKVGLKKFSTGESLGYPDKSSNRSPSPINIDDSSSADRHIRDADNKEKTKDYKVANGQGEDTSISNNQSQVSNVLESVSNAFRGCDDMEVTDEEFNLVVQHLKNLGEIRGEELSDEGEDGSLNDADASHNRSAVEFLRASSGLSNTGSNSDGLHGQDRLQYATGNSYVVDSGTSHDGRLQQGEDDAEKSRQNIQPFITDDDMHNQHLLQTLRQYLMPDNEQGDNYSAADFF